jgi:hypothetical protein
MYGLVKMRHVAKTLVTTGVFAGFAMALSGTASCELNGHLVLAP